MQTKKVDKRTLETALRNAAKAEGYGDYIPRAIIDQVVGKGPAAVRRVLKNERVPRVGNTHGALYQLKRVAEAFSR